LEKHSTFDILRKARQEGDKAMESIRVTHTFGPVFDEKSRILILGSFPSVKSREKQFYYGHPQNRFWKMLAGIAAAEPPETIEEKKEFLLGSRIAVWDVIESCEIEGSSDSSIRNVAANDMNLILRQAPIEKILCNGGKAYELFLKYCDAPWYPPVKKMPSTSPANASWKLERLIEEWGTELTGREQ